MGGTCMYNTHAPYTRVYIIHTHAHRTKSSYRMGSPCCRSWSGLRPMESAMRRTGSEGTKQRSTFCFWVCRGFLVWGGGLVRGWVGKGASFVGRGCLSGLVGDGGHCCSLSMAMASGVHTCTNTRIHPSIQCTHRSISFTSLWNQVGCAPPRSVTTVTKGILRLPGRRFGLFRCVNVSQRSVGHIQSTSRTASGPSVYTHAHTTLLLTSRPQWC